MRTTRAVARRRETSLDFGCRLLETRKEIVVGDGERIERVVEGRESIFLWEEWCCSLVGIGAQECLEVRGSLKRAKFIPFTTSLNDNTYLGTW